MLFSFSSAHTLQRHAEISRELSGRRRGAVRSRESWRREDANRQPLGVEDCYCFQRELWTVSGERRGKGRVSDEISANTHEKSRESEVFHLNRLQAESPFAWI